MDFICAILASIIGTLLIGKLCHGKNNNGNFNKSYSATEIKNQIGIASNIMIFILYIAIDTITDISNVGGGTGICWIVSFVLMVVISIGGYFIINGSIKEYALKSGFIKEGDGLSNILTPGRKKYNAVLILLLAVFHFSYKLLGSHIVESGTKASLLNSKVIFDETLILGIISVMAVDIIQIIRESRKPSE